MSPEAIDLEQVKTSDDVGSMASIREKHRAARQVLVGHPNDPTLAEKPPEVEELPEGKDLKPPEEEAKPPEEKVEVPPKEEIVVPPMGKEDRKYRFASQEEAERSHAEAEKKMHEATTEVSELRKRLEELEKSQSQPKEAPPPRPAPEEIEAEVESTWAAIDNLDPYEDGYTKKRAKLYTKLLTLQGAPAPAQVIDESQITKLVDERLSAERQAAEERRRQEEIARQEEANYQASRQAATQMAKDAGLNMDDGNTQRLFWSALQNAPYHEGVSLKEQVDYMVKEVKDFYTSVAKERGAAAPEQNVLERGGRVSPSIRETPEEEKPKTLSEMKDDWRERRRI